MCSFAVLHRILALSSKLHKGKFNKIKTKYLCCMEQVTQYKISFFQYDNI
jgi:hypothetical protein